jgi:hypothetical protein
VRNGFPRTVVGVLLALYGLSVLGLLGWFAYFASNTGVVLEQFSAAQALWLTAALSGGVALSSGLLTLHYSRESYGAGEEVLFRACLIDFDGLLAVLGYLGDAYRCVRLTANFREHPFQALE